MMLLELITVIRKFRKYFFVFFLLAIFSAAMILKYRSKVYHSYASIYSVTNYVKESDNLFTNSTNQKLFVETKNLNPIANIVYSEPMISHIIYKFNLYTLNGIDTTLENEKLIFSNGLADCIHVVDAKFNSIVIDVAQKDRFLAAAIANEIVDYAAILNKRILIKHRNDMIFIYDLVNQDLIKQQKVEQDTLFQVVQMMSLMVDKMSIKNDKSRNSLDAIAKLNGRISDLIDLLEKKIDCKVNKVLLEREFTTNENDYFAIKSKAFPEGERSDFAPFIVLAIVLFLSISAIFVFSVIALKKIKEEIVSGRL